MGFDPRTISRPGFVWQGDDDSFSTPAMASEWAATVPPLEARTLPGDEHLFPFSRSGEVIEALTKFE